MAARAGVEPMTLRTKGVDSTNVPLHATMSQQSHNAITVSEHHLKLPSEAKDTNTCVVCKEMVADI